MIVGETGRDAAICRQYHMKTMHSRHAATRAQLSRAQGTNAKTMVGVKHLQDPSIVVWQGTTCHAPLFFGLHSARPCVLGCPPHEPATTGIPALSAFICIKAKRVERRSLRF
jgi:hypothetical protein